jgi:hypothetical protein
MLAARFNLSDAGYYQRAHDSFGSSVITQAAHKRPELSGIIYNGYQSHLCERNRL